MGGAPLLLRPSVPELPAPPFSGRGAGTGAGETSDFSSTTDTGLFRWAGCCLCQNDESEDEGEKKKNISGSSVHNGYHWGRRRLERHFGSVGLLWGGKVDF